MSCDPIRVGTRASLLARTQTQWALDAVREHAPEVRFETVTIRTSGDVRTQEIPARFAGKGFFTKEIEEALLSGAVDLAIHSLKDLPADCPAGLALGALPPREDPRDALVGCTMAELRRASGTLRIGTSSLRRKAQLLRAFPGCQVVDLRGNIDTRLQRTKDGTVDAAVLAAAGLRRLGLSDAISACFDADLMLPPPGQGALALQIRADDQRLRDLLRPVHCSATASCVQAERSLMHALGGGCQLPVAALATIDGDQLLLRGRILSLDGTICLEGTRTGRPDEAETIGSDLAGELADQGATALIAEIERQLAEDSTR